MAQTAMDILGDRVTEAIVAATGHPFPDDGSVEAGRAALALAQRAGDRMLLVLLSGGASAMLCAPARGITLGDKATAARLLMGAGAGIHDLNCVRKHLSDIKGGRLAAAASSSLTLAISDVHHPVEDDPSTIGSGPTAADPTTFAQALDIAVKVDRMPRAVIDRLRAGAAGEVEETIKPGDPRLADARVAIVGNRRTALAAAASAAEALGYAVTIVSEPTHGEAAVAARTFLALADRQLRDASRPVCVLAAGETTVTVLGRGRGGRNQQFALAAADAGGARERPLHWRHPTVLVSGGTDGIDGPTPAAGAIVDSTTCDRAVAAGLSRERALADNDAYPFFEQLGDLIVTGPTGTNVGDLQVLVSSGSSGNSGDLGNFVNFGNSGNFGND